MTTFTARNATLYGSDKDAFEHMCDTLITEEPYATLFGPEQEAFHEWAFENSVRYVDGDYVDWVGAFYDWQEEQ
jgi:hypothetical protein